MVSHSLTLSLCLSLSLSLSREGYGLTPEPLILKRRDLCYYLNPKPETLDPEPETLNQTRNPKPETLTHNP
ncbi:hypothetical protein T484DRAFT_3173412 [Baffinella frigidus]|nr:hypothetical protein T484DRAFT_3173412 [Cryptophyta sp. CCMP2293]